MLNIVSFVDRDMVMRYVGGGIGHLTNTPPWQVSGFDPINPSSKEMAVGEEDDGDGPCSGTNEDLGTIVLEVGEDDENDEDDEDSDEGGDQTSEDEDDESGHSGDEEEEGGDDYGYASP
jgi:hypothetical protein